MFGHQYELLVQTNPIHTRSDVPHPPMENMGLHDKVPTHKTPEVPDNRIGILGLYEIEILSDNRLIRGNFRRIFLYNEVL